MSRIRISNQFWCLFGIRCDCFANLQGIHQVEVKWIIQEIHNLKIEKQNPSQKYLLLQPASTIPMGSTYKILSNMVSLKIKSTRWFDGTFLHPNWRSPTTFEWKGHLYNHPKNKVTNWITLVWCMNLATYNGILGRLLKDVINILNCTWPPQAPPPFIHKNDVTFK